MGIIRELTFDFSLIIIGEHYGSEDPAQEDGSLI